MIFNDLDRIFNKLENLDAKKIAIIFGNSIFSPKIIFLINFDINTPLKQKNDSLSNENELTLYKRKYIMELVKNNIMFKEIGICKAFVLLGIDKISSRMFDLEKLDNTGS